jgi:hypothetical protein
VLIAFYALAITVGPYLQDPHPDGAIVVWETDAPVAGELIVDDGRYRFASPSGTHHEVRATGLPPGRHRYTVSAGELTSAPGELTTAATGDRFTFLVYGDNRDRDADHARVVAAMAAEHADFVLHTGDMTGDAGVEALWRRFFEIEQPLLGSTAIYPAIGNHELLHDPLATHYRRYFALPGVDALEDAERYYAVRYGNALLVSLDGNQSHSREQARWLMATLDRAAADPAIRHRFVFFHQPPFAAGDECGSAAEQGLWVPELERRGVRAVFSSHDHAYERLERNGVRYFVTGGGGAPLHHESARCPPPDRQALRLFRAEHHYLRVRVSGDEVLLDAVAADGRTLDQVRLHEPLPPEPVAPPPVEYKDLPAAASPRIYAWLLALPLLATLLTVALRLRRARQI